MDTSSIHKFIFILNPTAGKHLALELKTQICAKFEELGLIDKCIFHFTERPLHATQLAREYAQKYNGDAIIYACGGDGTINEVANGIIGTSAIMSVIPSGTGNDFIKTLYTIRDSKAIIDNIQNYKIKRIDTAVIDGKTFINIASLGFDTIVGDKAKKMVAKAKFLGGSAYFLAIFVCLFGKNYEKMKYRFESIDDNNNPVVYEREMEFILAALANAQYYGGMFRPCPMADLSDGYLDVCIVERISIPKILSLIPKYIKGTHINEKVVKLYRVKSGLIEGCGSKLMVNCDGESFIEEKIKFQINPESITVAYY